MKFAEESCITMEDCIRRGMPMLLLSRGQAGATAPAPIALTIVQAVAECLAGVVYVNAIKKGAPAIFGTWPFVSDLRTGAMSGGSAEQALLTAGCAQMHRFYDLPGGAASGISDSKLPDMQAGWEQGITNVAGGSGGLNMCYEAVGMHASLLGFCLESPWCWAMTCWGRRCAGAGDRRDGGFHQHRGDEGGLSGRAGALSGVGSDAEPDADGIHLSQGGQPHEPEGMERGRETLLLDTAIRRKNDILSKAGCRVEPEIDAAIRARFNIYFR
jgi:trimethylamine---corrinoid protein Co-methyltransferase